MRWTLFAVVVAIGCGSKPAPEKPEPKPAPVVEKKPAPVPDAVAVSATAVGALTAEAEVSEAALAKLFPGYQLSSAVRTSEGQEVTVWELSRGGTLALVVEPNSEGKVFRVAIVDAEATTPAGIKIGVAFTDFVKAVPTHECFRLVEDRADSVACYAEGVGSVGYVFGHAARGYAGPPGTVPSKSAMSAATVTEILWLPETE